MNSKQVSISRISFIARDFQNVTPAINEGSLYIKTCHTCLLPSQFECALPSASSGSMVAAPDEDLSDGLDVNLLPGLTGYLYVLIFTLSFIPDSSLVKSPQKEK